MKKRNNEALRISLYEIMDKIPGFFNAFYVKAKSFVL